MGEARLLLRSFIGKDAAASEAASGAEEAAASTSPDGGNVDTSAVSKETAAVKSEQKKSKPALKVIQGGAKGMRESVPSISSLPTPGGIGLLLFIILFLLFAITKNSSGQTRLQLVWSSIMGNATWGNSGQTSDGSIQQSVQTATGSPYGYIPGAAIGVDPTNGGNWGNQWGGGFN